MRAYATAQLIGDRSHQCDAAATAAGADGLRAYALLDGIGSTDAVRDWTRRAARQVARAAASRGDAEAGLRAVYDRYAAEPERAEPWGDRPDACALVAVVGPGRDLTVAWCGDVRAYLQVGGLLRRLTQDHNARRVCPPCDAHGGGDRNVVTSHLGSTWDDAKTREYYGHPAVETARAGTAGIRCRLVLASDGGYEPIEDAGWNLADHLIGMPGEAAAHLVDTAVATARASASASADNATILVADLNVG